MAKKLKNRRRTKLASGLREKIFSRKGLIVLIPAIAVLIGFILIRNYLYKSPLFAIKGIELRGEGAGDSYLKEELSNIKKGANIFSVDIKDIEKSIEASIFEIKAVNVQRVFPNKLALHIRKRKPVAFIYSGYYYPVDGDAVVLKEVSQATEGRLPAIKGVYISRKDIGRKCKSPNLARALELLNEISRSNIWRRHKICEINAANSGNLSFIMDEGLEIRIGGESFRERLEVLKKVLTDRSVDLPGTGYIDLRFKDVVLGPK